MTWASAPGIEAKKLPEPWRADRDAANLATSFATHLLFERLRPKREDDEDLYPRDESWRLEPRVPRTLLGCLHGPSKQS